MSIISQGIDVVDLDRVRNELVNHREDFLWGWFSECEMSSSPSLNRECEYWAGRIAAKEATLKALVFDQKEIDYAWQDIRIRTKENGAPSIELTQGLERIAQRLQITSFMVSISHSYTVAVASVIAVSDSGMT